MSRRIAISAAALLVGASAQAASISLGNLTVYNSPLTFVNFNGPVGGPYVKFVYTTNWSYASGIVTSSQAAWNIGMPISSVVSAFTSVAGTANNANSTTITIAGNFNIPVTNSTALQFYASQNPNTIGQYNASAYWSNATLTFYTQKPPPPTPVGVIDMGAIHPSTGSQLTVSTTGSDFPIVAGLFLDDGTLVGANDPGTSGVPESQLDTVTLSPGSYYIFIAGEGTTLLPEDLEVAVPPEAPGGTLEGGINGIPWPQTTIAPGSGQWFSFTVAPPACPGDVTGDNHTDSSDFNVLASNFGAFVFPYTSGDLTGDGIVNTADFNILAGDYGCSVF